MNKDKIGLNFQTFLPLLYFLACIHSPANAGSCRPRSLLSDSTGEITDGAGNYYDFISCMYLIQLNDTTERIQLRFHELELECGWDYINIFDGDSLSSPRLMSISGDHLESNGVGDLSRLKLVSSSSRLLILFITDVAANEMGFNISYSSLPQLSHTEYNPCYSQCNETCLLRNNSLISQCAAPSFPAGDTPIFIPLPSLRPPLPRAGHTTNLFSGCLYVYGGYTFQSQPYYSVFRRCLPSEEWEHIIPGPSSGPWPAPRYGHTSVVYRDSMYVYGGTTIAHGEEFKNEITNELWRLNLTSLTWSYLSSSNQTLPSTGHVSELVTGGRMVVLFGHSTDKLELLSSREYLIDSDRWEHFTISSSLNHGYTYSASAYSPAYNLIFVYGGYKRVARYSNPALNAYHPETHSWTSLPTNTLSESVYQHAMVLVNDSYLLVNGGYRGLDGKCGFSPTFVYDLKCGHWHSLVTESQSLFTDREGHSLTAVSSDSVLLFGGYNQAILFNDLLQLNLSRLSLALNLTACVDSINCQQHPCVACLSAAECEWDDTSCQPASNSTAVSSQLMPNASICQTGAYDGCSSAGDCWECQVREGCVWDRECREKLRQNETAATCSAGCGSFSCQECVTNPKPCLYCPSQQRCVSNNYPMEFPYGECLVWTANIGNCSTDTYAPCSAHTTCEKCQADYNCGWCATHSSGLGECMEGSQTSPASNACALDSWNYFSCPLCQCNGHSYCDNSSNCLECKNNTQGLHCDTCAPWYHGDATNGNTCSECECSVYAAKCYADSGNCECNAYGVIGSHCDTCQFNGTVNTSCYRYQEPQTKRDYTSVNSYSRSILLMTRADGQKQVSMQFTIFPHNSPAYTLIQVYRAVRSNSKILDSLSSLLDELSSSVREELIDKLTQNTTNRIVQVYGELYELEKLEDDVLLVANQSVPLSFYQDYIRFHNSVLYHISPQDLGTGNDYIFIELSNQSYPCIIEVNLVPEDVVLIVAVLVFLSVVLVFFFLMVLILLGWHIKKQVEFRQARVRRRRERVVMATRPASVSSLLAESVGPDAGNFVMARAIADQPLYNSKVSLSTFLISMPNNPDDPNRMPLYCGTALVTTNRTRDSKIFSNQTA